MRYFLLLIFFCFTTSLTIAQEQFLYSEIKKDLEPIDSLYFEDFFKNGKIKERGKLYKYIVDGEEIIRPTSYLYEFYKDGTFKRIYEFDKYGIVLSHRLYLCANEIFYEKSLVKIITNQSSILDYLKSEGYFKNYYSTKTYGYSFKNECSWLKKEGLESNGEKIGDWIFYKPDGSIKKTKTY